MHYFSNNLITSRMLTLFFYPTSPVSFSNLFINPLTPLLSPPGLNAVFPSVAELSLSLPHPLLTAHFPVSPLFSSILLLLIISFEYTPLCHSLLGALNFPPSPHSLFFFPPRALTKLNPSPTQMHSISFTNTHIGPNM